MGQKSKKAKGLLYLDNNSLLSKEVRQMLKLDNMANTYKIHTTRQYQPKQRNDGARQISHFQVQQSEYETPDFSKTTTQSFSTLRDNRTKVSFYQERDSDQYTAAGTSLVNRKSSYVNESVNVKQYREPFRRKVSQQLLPLTYKIKQKQSIKIHIARNQKQTTNAYSPIPQLQDNQYVRPSSRLKTQSQLTAHRSSFTIQTPKRQINSPKPIEEQKQQSPARLQLNNLLNDMTVTVSRMARRQRTPTKGDIMDSQITKILSQHAYHVQPVQISNSDILNQDIFEQGKGTDVDAVKISHALFVQAQFSDQQLTKVNSFGNSFLYNDNRSGIVVADRGKQGGSKFRHIIEEHERLRRARAVQDKLLKKKLTSPTFSEIQIQTEKTARREIQCQTNPLTEKSMVQKTEKWVATKEGYKKVNTQLVLS